MNDFTKLIDLMEDINCIYLSLFKLECLGDRENSCFLIKLMN